MRDVRSRCFQDVEDLGGGVFISAGVDNQRGSCVMGLINGENISYTDSGDHNIVWPSHRAEGLGTALHMQISSA